jgi:hypothetical protein
MVITLGADIVVAFDIRAVKYRIALDAFFPQTLGNTAGALLALLAAHSRR